MFTRVIDRQGSIVILKDRVLIKVTKRQMLYKELNNMALQYRCYSIFQLDNLYGTWRKNSTEKKVWNLPQPKMAVTDLSKLLKSEEIRKVLRAPNRKINRAVAKTNPLKNVRTMLQLNPYAAVTKRNAQLISKSRAAAKAAVVAKQAGQKPKPDPLAKRKAALAKQGKGKKK